MNIQIKNIYKFNFVFASNVDSVVKSKCINIVCFYLLFINLYGIYIIDMDSSEQDGEKYQYSRNSNTHKNKHIDFKLNGRLFPTWVVANFKPYKLPHVIRKDDEDPCFAKTKLEFKSYQTFIGKYLDYNSPYRDILIYHGLGSGKTASAINVYNVLYTYTPGWNVFIMIKASLRNHPWMTDLKKWLQEDEYDFRMKNIIFIHYDAPNADKQFMNAIKSVDASKKSIYIFDEVHNFIRNVYSNISSTAGKRAQTIYDYIIQEKKEGEGTRVVCLSATPAINTPYELALLFNLLRPGIFPRSENEFNHIYVSTSSYKTISLLHKNMFQRRITGLVSFYIGATPDLYATKSLQYVDVKMSKYQEEIYLFFEDIEETIAKRKRKTGKSGQEMYKSYTRQASNFVFPFINQKVTGETRPRPNKFRLTDKDSELVKTGRQKQTDTVEKLTNVSKYVEAMGEYVKLFDDHLYSKRKDDAVKKHTLEDDMKIFLKKYNGNVDEFLDSGKFSSELLTMHTCSAKMVHIVLNIMKSPGPVLVYSNYVLMEGLEIFKIYLKHLGFNHYKERPLNFFGYTEYHGGVTMEDRSASLIEFNKLNNMKGEKIKIMMVSPAGAEGLSLENVRQVHIMEPYWHEVRITQMIGRAVRYCSHKNLPQSERHVNVFRYKSVRDTKWTTDQNIEDRARTKDSLIQSFLDAIKESAIDCILNKNHNMLVQEYKCFQFDEQSLFDEHIGPAYKEDLYDDMKIDNGSNSMKSMTVKIKVMKISAVKKLSEGSENPKYSKPEDYWFYESSGTVYDFDLKYPIGKISFDDNDIPNKLNKDTYIIDQIIPIPMIDA